MRLHSLIAALGVAIAYVPTTASAQAVRLPGSVEPGREKPSVTAPIPQTDFDLTIQSPRRAPIPRAVDELRFELRDIRLQGANRYPESELRALWEPLIGTQVGLSDINGVADAIEARYRRDGFILTRAFVPPQRVANGVFTINVVEGYVAAVAVEGGKPGTRERVEALLRPVVEGKPLSQEVIERALLLANDLPGIEATSVLRPSPNQPGASDLVVSVVEHPVSGSADVDNRGSKANGPWVAAGSVQANNLFDEGGALALDGGYTFWGEKYGVGTRYSLPLLHNGLQATAFGQVYRGEPGAALRELEVVTQSLVTGLRVLYPVWRTRSDNLSVEGGFTLQEADVHLLGNPNSHDSWRVIDLQLNWSNNGWLRGNTGANVRVSQGLPILHASTELNEERSRSDGHAVFTKVSAAARRLQALFDPVSLLVAGTVQHSAQGLLAGEEISFGGNPAGEFGRGYDPAAITGDDGFGGTVELRWDEFFAEPVLSVLQNAQFYAFVDGGRVFNKSDSGGAPNSIASTGIGVRTALVENVTAGVEIARTLLAVPGSDNGERTTKILFSAAFRF